MAGEDPKLVRCNFQLSFHGSQSDIVCLTGDHSALGSWNVGDVKQLEKQSQSGNGDAVTWTLSCDIPAGELSYRYVITRPLSTCQLTSASHWVLREWETVKRTVVLDPAGNGHCFKDQYGIGTGGCSLNPERGFLTGESEIQLRISRQRYEPLTPPVVFHDESPPPVGNLEKDLCEVHVEPFWFAPRNEDYDTGVPCPPLEVKTMVSTSGLCDGPSPHGSKDWVAYNINNTIVFSQSSCDLQRQAYSVHVRHQPQGGGDVVTARGCVLPEHIQQASTTSVTVPLFDSQMSCIGQIAVDCLVVKPFRSCHDLSFSKFCTWVPNKSLCIGHRGMGSSYALSPSTASYVENTVASLATAATYGADMVEFDVQLSLDLVPIVFHDFTFQARPNPTTAQRHEVRVQDCTLASLRSMDIDTSYVLPKGKEALKKVEVNISHLDLASSLPGKCTASSHPALFPTLEEAFQRTPETLGFYIELKFPISVFDPPDVVDSYFDVNVFVDAILDVVFRCAGNRDILLTSFCPNTCILLRRKQCRYPVVFISDINDPEYDIPDDIRCASLNDGSAFAHSEKLTGIAVHSGQLLADPALIDDVVSKHNLVLLTWSSNNNKAKNIRYQVRHGVHGVCSDAIDRIPKPTGGI